MRSSLFLLLVLLLSFQDMPTPAKIQLWKQAAHTHKTQQQWDSALYYYDKAIAGFEKLGKKDSALALYEPLYNIYINQFVQGTLGLEEVTQFMDSKWAAVAQSNKPQLLGDWYVSKLQLYNWENKEDSVLFYYAACANIYQANRQWKELLDIESLVSMFYYNNDMLTKAEEYLAKAENVASKLSNKNDLFSLYSSEVNIYIETGNYSKALKAALESIAILESKNDQVSLITYYNNLAIIYDGLKDYDKAIDYYNKSLRLVMEYTEEDASAIAVANYNIGTTYLVKPNYKEAIKWYKKVLLQLAQIKEQDEYTMGIYIDVNRSLSDVYLNLDSLKLAEEFIRKNEPLHKKINYRQAATYEQQAKICKYKKEYKTAISYTQKALVLDSTQYRGKHTFVAHHHLIYAQIYSQQQQYDLALYSLQKGLEAITQDFTYKTYLDNPKVEDVSDKERMLDILQEKVKILQLYRAQKPTIAALKDIYAIAKTSTEVLEKLHQNITTVSSRYEWLNKRAGECYGQAVDLAAEIYEETNDKQFLNEAFMLSERSKSILLMEALQSENMSYTGVPDSLLEQEKELRFDIARAEKKRFDAQTRKDTVDFRLQEEQLFKFKQEFDILQHNLETNYNSYYKLKHLTDIASIEKIQKNIDSDALFIEYFLSANNYYVFAIDKQTVKLFKVSEKDSCFKDIVLYQKLMMNAKFAIDDLENVQKVMANVGWSLYGKLVQPALALEKQPKRLIIIPDGKLVYIPFEALLTKEPTKYDFSSQPYLLRKYIVNYNYSGTLWLEQQGQHLFVDNIRCLAMAATYNKSDIPENRNAREKKMRKNLGELAGVLAEVKNLQTSWAGDGAFYTDKQANERTFKQQAPNYGILHLAMHGIVDEQNPDLSSLAFTENGDSTEDNFLYAYEIKQLKLNAALVVLSACETGSGKYQRGEGILSIGRGFMFAGTPSLVMTLWQLNDQSSAIIMESFYKELEKGTEKDAALRNAKLEYLDRTTGLAAHPALWACFVQLGNYDKITTHKTNWLSIVSIAGASLLLLGGILFFRKRKKLV